MMGGVTTFATCSHCETEMGRGGSCTQAVYEDFPGDEAVYQRIPSSEDDNCHDCNARPGGLHHPGCDMERCPRCDGQAIGCDCMEVDA